MSFSTRCIHPPSAPSVGVNNPIELSSTFIHDSSPDSYSYGRTDNPTRSALESAISSLEYSSVPSPSPLSSSTKDTTTATSVFSSGMAAIEASILATLDSHPPSNKISVICSSKCYGGTTRWLEEVWVSRMNREVRRLRRTLGGNPHSTYRPNPFCAPRLVSLAAFNRCTTSTSTLPPLSV